MDFKILGGILLIVGTAIGGGMLALPIVMAQGGFIGATLLLIGSWIVMTYSAFLLLEVNMWMPLNSNIILMAKKTLGRKAELIAWISYLLLFYCLLAAYIAGGSEVLTGILTGLGFSPNNLVNAVLFTALLGVIVFLGIRTVDYTNRILMIIKLGAFIVLSLFLLPHIKLKQYFDGQPLLLVPAITVVLTSFGFSTIIPSLRVYFHNDIRKLRKVILIGSLIPLACYILWVAVIFGSISYQGDNGLNHMVASQNQLLALTQAIIHESQNNSIPFLTHLFTGVCVFTSFLAVSLCVVDFLADGFQLEKTGGQKLFLHAITFFPPLIIAVFYPTVFIKGLNYAGICLAILILLFPALMVWRGRYIIKYPSQYQVVGGKLPLVIVIFAALLVIIKGLF